jgi:hypothetical protein
LQRTTPGQYHPYNPGEVTVGSFSIWHWLIVLVPIIIVYAIVRPRNDTLKGIQGWLGLLAVWQVLGIARIAFGFLYQLKLYSGYAQISGAQAVLFGEITLNAASFAIFVGTTFALFGKKCSFRSWLLWQWLSIPIIAILDLVLISGVTNIGVRQLVEYADVGQTVASFIVMGLWVLYSRKSRRVTNTMTVGGPVGTPPQYNLGDHIDNAPSEQNNPKQYGSTYSGSDTMKALLGGAIGFVFFAIALLMYFPGGTIYMAMRCNSRDLSGWDWVLSVVVPFYGLFKGTFGC